MTAPDPALAPARDERPSKSARKRDAHQQQALGQALSALSEGALAATPMPESLRDALLELRRTRSHEGRRRQLQYVGKLMRQADLEPLREAVAAATLGRASDALRLHEAEAWRARLVDGDEALTEWMAAHPATDLPQLRSLIRHARKDAALPPEQRHGRAWRELFRFLMPHLSDSDHE